VKPEDQARQQGVRPEDQAGQQEPDQQPDADNPPQNQGETP